MRHTCVGAPQSLWYVGVPHAEAADMRLVNHGLVQRRTWRFVSFPVERGIYDDAPRGAERWPRIWRQVGPRATYLIGEAAELPALPSRQCLCIRVEQHDLGVEAQAASWIVGPVDAVPIALAGVELGNV